MDNAKTIENLEERFKVLNREYHEDIDSKQPEAFERLSKMRNRLCPIFLRMYELMLKALDPDTKFKAGNPHLGDDPKRYGDHLYCYLSNRHDRMRDKLAWAERYYYTVFTRGPPDGNDVTYEDFVRVMEVCEVHFDTDLVAKHIENLADAMY